MLSGQPLSQQDNTITPSGSQTTCTLGLIVFAKYHPHGVALMEACYRRSPIGQRPRRRMPEKVRGPHVTAEVRRKIRSQHPQAPQHERFSV